MNPPELIPKIKARLAREGWTDNLGTWAPCRPTDLNISSVIETVTLTERDPSPIVPRRIACDGVSAKECG